MENAEADVKATTEANASFIFEIRGRSTGSLDNTLLTTLKYIWENAVFLLKYCQEKHDCDILCLSLYY